MPRRRPAPGGRPLLLRGSASLLAFLALLGVTQPASAADDGAVQTIPDPSYAALVTDFDRDGAADLVRIRRDGRSNHVVEVWSVDAGEPRLLGDVAIPFPVVSRDGAISAWSDMSGLVLWRLDGAVRVLAIASWREIPPDPACCLEIYEVIPRRGGGIDLAPRLAGGRAADGIHLLDVDGDGTDEIARQVGGPNPEDAQIEILRFDGDGFRSTFIQDGPRAGGPFWVGDTDGVAGDDLIIGPNEGAEVVRIAWSGDGTRSEFARFPTGAGLDGWIFGAADDALVLSSSTGIQLVRWPRGGQPRTVARLTGAMYVAGILNGPDGALIATQEPTAPFGVDDTVTIYDSDLQRVGQVASNPTATTLAEVLNLPGTSSHGWEQYPWPYQGAFLGGDEDVHDGFAWNGVLISATGPRDFESTPIDILPNLQPVGRVGPGDEWIVLYSGFGSGARAAYLFSGPMPDEFGGIVLVPAERVIGAGASGGSPRIEVRGAIVGADQPNEAAELIAPGAGFEVTVSAPSGSRLATFDGSGVTEEVVEGPTTTVRIQPPDSAAEDKNRRLEAAIVVTTPDGDVAAERWTGTYIREPPALSIEGHTDTFAFGATLVGEVAGARPSLDVDGRPAPLDAAGRFEVTLGAVPWPHDVVVTARDAVGNVTTERVQVIGLVDYRGLPWAAIAVLAVIGAGALLFARIPKVRSAVPVRAGDGRLEELELDEIEALTERRPGRR